MRTSLRTLLAAAVTMLLVGLPVALPGTAGASTREVTDTDDTSGRLDVAAATHGHEGRALVHTVRMQGRWRSSVLEGGLVTVLFKVGRRYRTLNVDFRDGRLVGKICTEAPDGELSDCSRDVGLNRPGRRTLQVTLARRLLRGGLSAYSWQVVTLLDLGEGACPDTVCLDQLPDDDEWVKHRV